MLGIGNARVIGSLMLLAIVSACGRESVVGLDPARTGTDATQDAMVIMDAEPPPPTGQDGDLPDYDQGDFGPGTFPAEVGVDAGPLLDADRTDAFTPLEDTGIPSADAAPSLDGGTSPPDSGIPTADSGTSVPDSGTSAPDSGAAPLCTSNQDCGQGEYCEPTLQICVECYQDSQCSRRRTCDTMNGHLCRDECWGTFCLDNNICDPSTGLCVGCFTTADCDSGEVCDTTNRTCVECLGNSDCASFSGRPVCETSVNECVECVSNNDCTAPDICTVNNECRLPSNRPICEPCTLDAECGGADDLCLDLVNGDQSCGQDCTNATCPRGYDCIDTRSNTARQCRPSYQMMTPTCVGIRNLGNSCSYSFRDPDPGCGIRNVQDARCVRDSSDPLGGVCVVWCQTDDHCPVSLMCDQQATLTYGYCK
jgi:hypothetical protein